MQNASHGIFPAQIKLYFVQEGFFMNLGWICGFFVGILGIISHFTYIHMASEYNYWLLVIGFFLVSLSGPRRF